MNKHKYYVYQYLREDNTPYYIGKGFGYRMFDKNHSIYVPKDKSRIEVILDNLSEESAHLLEIELIKYYGRKDKGTGILRNKTDGGEGVSGYKHTLQSKEKMSKSQRTKALTYNYTPDRIKGNRTRYKTCKYWFYHPEYGTTYMYITELAVMYNIKPSAFYKILSGRNKTAYNWSIILRPTM